MASEDRKEKLDRELIELLNELRVALPGVQVLFAFLLAVPFTQRFTEVSEGQRDVYYVALIATVLGSVLLMAPTAYHRIRWRQRDKEQMLRTANRLAIAGMTALGVAMVAVIYVVSDLLFDGAFTWLMTGLIALWTLWFWYGLPLMRALQDERD